MIERVLFLDVSATIFVQWLAEYTRGAPDRVFPTERGHLALQSLRAPHSVTQPTSVAMESLYVAPRADGTDVGFLGPNMIVFRLIPLGAERVEVRAKCNQPAVEAYFDELLAAIEQRWPTRADGASPHGIPADKPAGAAPSTAAAAPSTRGRTTVFVSYSHKDKKWLDELQVHLKPLEREGLFDLWVDTRLKMGAKWREEIREAIRQAKIAILLVSANFLASDFISTDELPPLLSAAEKEKAVIMPVIVRLCAFSKTPLNQFQAANDPSKPLASMKPSERDKVYLRVREAIEDALREPVLPLGSGGARDATLFRVLVVDDSRSDRWRMRQLLEAGGWEVAEAATNTEALELMSNTRRPFSLVTTDAYRRPERSGEKGYAGLELARLINERFPSVPVVLVSKDPPEYLRKQAPDLRIKAVIRKDMPEREIVSGVGRVLHGETLPNPWSS